MYGLQINFYDNLKICAKFNSIKKMSTQDNVNIKSYVLRNYL